MSRNHLKKLKATAGAYAPALRTAVGKVTLRWKTILGSVLIIVGIVGLGLPFVSFTVASPQDVLIAGQPTGDSAPPSVTPEPGLSAEEIERREVTERLIIDEVGINMPLFTGDLEEGLRKGAWLMGGTQPGEVGNTVIFGHRFKYLPPLSNTMFRLGGVEHGDRFTIRWGDEVLVYEVAEIRIIDPTEVDVIRDQGDERVTLITCHPVWSTKQRLIVVGFPVAVEPAL